MLYSHFTGIVTRAGWTSFQHSNVSSAFCVAGRGYYQEWGKEARELHPGDVVNIPVGVKHWHGAAPDSWFSHLAVEVPGKNTSNEWLEAVDDETYGRLK